MSLVSGENMIGFIYNNDAWRPWVCSRGMSLNTSTGFIETSTKGTGLWETVKPTKNSWNASADGIVSLGGTDLTLPDLRSLQISQTLILLRWQRTAVDGTTVYIDEGYAYLAAVSDTGSFDNVATFSMEFKGTGPITQLFTPTIPGAGTDMRTEYTGVGGEATIESADLLNKYLLVVDKDGVGRATIITIGTPDPDTKQVLYESNIGGGLGRLTFSQTFEANEMAYWVWRSL